MTPSVLTVIVCVRPNNSRPDLLERLSLALDDPHRPENVEFLVVEDGSLPHQLEELKAAIPADARLLSTRASPESRFNLARARNVGALHAAGDFVMFMDADLAPYPGFYCDILAEAELAQMQSHPARFLMVPVIYLTEEGHCLYNEAPLHLRRSLAINAMLSGDSELIEKYSSGTSVIVVNRVHYHAIGGQDEDFDGWGFEDYEFNTRLMLEEKRMPEPESWLSMAGNFMKIKSYEGWKAAYRLHGDWLANKGIYLIHLPHPTDGDYRDNEAANLKRLQTKMRIAYEGDNFPPPRPLNSDSQTLILRRDPFCYHRYFAPFLGQVKFETEDAFPNEEAFGEYIQRHGIDRVIFPNPYGNEKRLRLYRYCRDQHISFFVAERGALPDSVYHDGTGFLNDSTSYDAQRWDKPLSEKDKVRIGDYISNVYTSGHALERQNDPIGVAPLREALGVIDSKKILLVPLQQPHDTVIQHFTGPVKGFENFLRLVEGIAARLGDDWTVVYKKHPAEETQRRLIGCVDASDANIYDLIQLADAVLVINSGTGVLAMMADKPVYVAGDAWYSHTGLTCTVEPDADRTAKLIRSQSFHPDKERVLRFLHYLRFGFYSFGLMKQRHVKMADGNSITATSAINYYELRGWYSETLYYDAQPKPLPFTSPLFDRYRGSSYSINRSQHAVTNNEPSRWHRRLSKLRKNPRQYFTDSKIAPLRLLRFFFAN